uniref:Uncharacterized protein n=1 Tax=Chromera velia CCMP2878 TaxID=1169474 RepID=A0A0G4G9V3_9ALVE|mmetsp:Transcript_44348/g.87580  ORF Transcript_44348/g.87580 Transcript_44348/m.87580 type:complete len:228 (-) Transcript_44348:574-1257(-)|eukprot:Cvel_594.t1-p1 / transcript=Cvel_594.t1 / gene=Cvel_594 / organism=Chromera_velia_CCMP2878 / gene_product=hypothetical protein / transcript_product=hypothetical protein / location=Cvel_scaffold18:127674-129216(+) / protein_length=227 / sequence_SO=supercontig / SO=protein_coding / is_pseudo=false
MDRRGERRISQAFQVVLSTIFVTHMCAAASLAPSSRQGGGAFLSAPVSVSRLSASSSYSPSAPLSRKEDTFQKLHGPASRGAVSQVGLVPLGAETSELLAAAASVTSSSASFPSLDMSMVEKFGPLASLSLCFLLLLQNAALQSKVTQLEKAMKGGGGKARRQTVSSSGGCASAQDVDARLSDEIADLKRDLVRIDTKANYLETDMKTTERKMKSIIDWLSNPPQML